MALLYPRLSSQVVSYLFPHYLPYLYFIFHQTLINVSLHISFLSHLPLRSPTNPTRKEDNMPPMEKIATDNDQYMVTAGCCPTCETVLFSDSTASVSDHTPKERP